MSETQNEELKIEEISRKAKKILRQNAVYIRYPMLDRNGEFTGKQAAHLYIIFDKQKEGLSQDQMATMESYLQEGYPHSFVNTNTSYPYISDIYQKRSPSVLLLDDNADPKEASHYDMSNVRKRFERYCLADIGILVEPKRAQIKSLFDKENRVRDEIIAHFGGKEIIPMAAVEGLDRKLFQRWARFFSEGEYYLDANDSPVKETKLERADDFHFIHYTEADDGTLIPNESKASRYTRREDGVLELTPSPQGKGALKPAVHIVSASDVINDFGADLILEARKAKAGIPIDYPVTRCRSRNSSLS